MYRFNLLEGILFVNKKLLNRVDVQVSLLVTAVVLVSSLSIFALVYTLSYQEMLSMMEENVNSLADYIDAGMNKDIFQAIQVEEDMESDGYAEVHGFLNDARMISGTKYLYTAIRNDDGDLIYHIDGLDFDDEDFRNVGDLIEEDFQEPLITALEGEIVMPDDILNTEWGDVFVAYYPLHNEEGETVAVVGIEFPADSQYQSFQSIRTYTIFLIIVVCIIAGLVVHILFRRISNPHFKDIYNSDYLTRLKNRTAFELDIQNSIYQKNAQGYILVLTDLNGLKQVNDQSGHKAGDRYIQACAQALDVPGLEDSVIYRIGGDEFATIIPPYYSTQISVYMERVKEKIKEVQSTEIPHPSVAMGYATCQGNSLLHWEEAQKEADLAMYQDKQSYYQNL